MSETQILGNKDNGKKSSASRIKLLAAIATGVLTIEAANALLNQENPDEDPITDEEVLAATDELALSANANNDVANDTPQQESEYMDEPASIDELGTIDLPDTETEIITDAEPIELADSEIEIITDAEPIELADTETEIITDAEPVELADTETEIITDAEPVELADTETEIITGAEPVELADTETEIITDAEPIELADTETEIITDAEPIELADMDDSIADTIIQEIDTDDIDMADAFTVDSVGSVVNVDGNEYQAATILDPDGNQAFMFDMDGDNVYDVITTPSGDVIADMNSDIDVSDAELMFAQQHEHDGYIAQNDFDISMNEDNPDIQDDIMLS